MAFKDKYRQEISIFDVDDTLVTTKSRVKVYNTLTDETKELTPDEYNKFKKEDHHILDFSEFDCPTLLKAGLIIERVFIKLLKAMAKGKSVGVITARGNADTIKDFFSYHDIDIKRELIFAVNNQDDKRFIGTVAEKKKIALKEFIKMGYRNIEFFDDNENNLNAAKELEEEEGIEIKTFLIESD